MQYTFQTDYNQKSLSVMAKCIRKTARAKRSKRSHIFGWIVIALALLLSFSSGDEGFTITFRAVITWIAAAVMLFVLLFEDQINGYFAKKRMLSAILFTNDSTVSLSLFVIMDIQLLFF